jgi:hypothetical protein
MLDQGDLPNVWFPTLVVLPIAFTAGAKTRLNLILIETTKDAFR